MMSAATIAVCAQLSLKPNRGWSLDERGQFQQAINDYTVCIWLKPEFPDAYAARAQTYGIIHREKDAIAYYDKLISLRLNDPNPYLYRAVGYFNLCNYEKCIENCTASIDIEAVNSAYVQRSLERQIRQAQVGGRGPAENSH